MLERKTRRFGWIAWLVAAPLVLGGSDAAAQGEIRSPLDPELEVRASVERQVRFERAYRRVLESWARELSVGAASELVELERGLRSVDPTCRELLNIHELGQIEPQSLAAVAGLHRLTFTEYLDRGGASAWGDLAEHALALVEHSGARLERWGRSKEASLDAAVALGAVYAAAGDLRGERLLGRIASTIDRALRWAPEDPDLLAVGADLDEKLGRTKEALSKLVRLNAAAESDRARFAEILARFRAGRERDESLSALRGLIEGAQIEWIRDAARELLDDVEPTERGSQFALHGRPSYGLELQRAARAPEGSATRADAAREILRRAVDIGPAARALYDQGPVAEREALRERAARSVRSSRSALLESLPRLPKRPMSRIFMPTVTCEDLLRFVD